MKIIIISLGLCIGLFLGLFPNLNKAKPLYWKILAVFAMSLLIVLSLATPLGGTFSVAVQMEKVNKKIPVNVFIRPIPSTVNFDSINNFWKIEAYEGSTGNFINKVTKLSLPKRIFINSSHLPEEFNINKNLIVKLRYNKQNDVFNYISTECVNPSIMFPFIPDLGERIRIIYFHVPCGWIAALAFILSMVFSIKYLKTKKIINDVIASSSAGLGMMFCILATITGSIWAKFNWGSFWNWDPRETSIFILLTIYFAYFALRSALENEEIKARLSAVYSILASISVPFFIFIMPRITSGLHPGSMDDTSSGPILSAQSDMLNFTKQIILSLSLCSFTILYFWLLNLSIRIRKLKYYVRISN